MSLDLVRILPVGFHCTECAPRPAPADRPNPKHVCAWCREGKLDTSGVAPEVNDFEPGPDEGGASIRFSVALPSKADQ